MTKPLKKLFVSLSIASFFLLATVSALSVVPHHHDKAHHESEETCPICQVLAHPVHLETSTAEVITTILFVLFILLESNYLYDTKKFLDSPPTTFEYISYLQNYF